MIYFVQAESGGLVKIGFANDPEQRLAGLQIGSPLPLVLLHTEEGSQEDESLMHIQFGHLRVRGEWFYPTTELADYCGAIPAQDTEMIGALIEKARRIGREEGFAEGQEVPNRRRDDLLREALMSLSPYTEHGTKIYVDGDKGREDVDLGRLARTVALLACELPPIEDVVVRVSPVLVLG